MQLMISSTLHCFPIAAHVQSLLQKSDLHECFWMISSPFKRYLLVLKTVVVTLTPVVFSPALFSAQMVRTKMSGSDLGTFTEIWDCALFA